MRPESNSLLAERTWIEVDLGALLGNARTVAQRSGARLLPMVKANAYGLGAVRVARSLEALEPWGFGVATPEEGTELRAAGITRPVLVFSLVTAALGTAAEYGLTPVLDTIEQVRAWRALAADRPFHVQVDSGMGRAGIWWEAFASHADELGAAGGLEGVCTHFHSADADPASVREQWARFQAALGALRRRPALVHAANSAAALRHPETAADLVRPGIFLYGGDVGADARPRPVATWRARVLDVKWREAGATVSYDATYVTPRRTCLTTLAAGYADGYPRALSSRGDVLIGGRRLHIAGLVTMDMIVVADHEWAPEPDAVATLVGSDGDDEITLDSFAAAADTISYDVLTGLGPRVLRVYG